MKTRAAFPPLAFQFGRDADDCQGAQFARMQINSGDADALAAQDAANQLHQSLADDARLG